ncbi:MAG TPA: Rieske (2Fe-2S) protein, partial [Blastocatellia bacterium]
VDLNGRPVALFNVNGEFIALDNVCAHRGGPLAEGLVDPMNMSVQCPWHGWSFGLTDGKCRIGPGGVEKFEVKVEGTDVMIAV